MKRVTSLTRTAVRWLYLVAMRIQSLRNNSSLPLALSTDLADDKGIANIIGPNLGIYSALLPKNAPLFVGWGARRSGQRARDLARKFGKPYILFEDGFLRSVKRDGPRLSTLSDRQNPHFFAGGPTDLEQLISRDLSAAEKARARSIARVWRKSRVSKYNDSPNIDPKPSPDFVLVVDQVRADKSIEYGCADSSSFARALEAALVENPASQIVVKVHPDAAVDHGKSHFDLSALGKMDRVTVVDDDVHVVDFLELAKTVYVVTSQVGLEALIWGKPVRVFGMPFYAGWGLTKDELKRPLRRTDVTLEQLVHAVLVEYPCYHDPISGKPCEPEVVLAHVALQRRMRMDSHHKMVAVGFSPWKRSFIKDFVAADLVRFVTPRRANRELGSQTSVLIWGSKLREILIRDHDLIQIEDGFVRSKGLGAALVRPLSLIIDEMGIYYDSTRPSGLESFLCTHSFDEVEIARAAALRQRIIDCGITKYNLGGRDWQRPAGHRRAILVVGQVEGDASIAFGSPEIKTNLELVRRVRRSAPDAYIVYKPHPDVVAGFRDRGSAEGEIKTSCNEILVGDHSIDNLISQVDEVHTMTSLLGFEALLRGTKVVCYGLPFYAGWGLTDDLLICGRRARKLSLDQLVYGALIFYPRYFSRVESIFLEPEQALDELERWKQESSNKITWRSSEFIRPMFYVAQITRLFRS